ncbi:hypothetical protein Taro_014231 [Colocasia esculenta]|uniref:Surfeit locus protein 6 n=1 Tax=Colocasia esculenta TaxID=4460 RepID=A0A843UHN6_COLES|nr:hypothetical protein [Colocasia esculenta]
MKKKKSQKPSPAVEPSTAAPAAGAADLKALIRGHSLFFDRLVDLIPARFYLPAPDDDERPWYPGLSKQARASAKKQSRENTKKSRRARLDPEKSSSTLDLLKRRVEADQSDGAIVADGEEDIAPAAADRSVTYEELRERLRRRIEELRSNRNTRPSDKPKNDAGDRKKGKAKEKGDSGSGKRKREEISQEEAVEKKKKKKPVEEKERDASAVELAFGHVKIGGADDKMGKKKKRKKVSKLQTLEKAKQLEEARKDPEKGETVSKKHSWKAAVSRAAGVKVHDDPKLLKESIKKENKRHQKSVEKWKERVKSREKLKAEKQKTRSDNIKERIHQKKMRKIEKREKKLMRPGFEGRKEGYINEAGS